MKRFALVFLCLVLVCLGFVSCGKKVETKESKTYHFEGYDLSFSVPKGWKVEQATEDFEKGPVNFLYIRGITYKDDVSYEDIAFYISRPKDSINNRIEDLDESKCNKYGNYYIYVPIYNPTEQPAGGLYIEKNLSFGLWLYNVPMMKITPELEAIFNSFRIEKTGSNLPGKDI